MILQDVKFCIFARATTTTRTTCAMSTTTGTRTTTTTTTAMASRRIRWSYHVASQAAKQRRRATPRIVPRIYYCPSNYGLFWMHWFTFVD